MPLLILFCSNISINCSISFIFVKFIPQISFNAIDSFPSFIDIIYISKSFTVFGLLLYDAYNSASVSSLLPKIFFKRLTIF